MKLACPSTKLTMYETASYSQDLHSQTNPLNCEWIKAFYQGFYKETVCDGSSSKAEYYTCEFALAQVQPVVFPAASVKQVPKSQNLSKFNGAEEISVNLLDVSLHPQTNHLE